MKTARTSSPGRQSAARGARTTVLGQWSRFVVQFLGFVLLARLLSPQAFGLVAMVSALMAFASLLADLGLSLAGIQATELTQRDKSALFWANIAAGCAGSVLVAASAPLLAAFYHEPRVIPVGLALSGTLLVSSAAVQFRVEINRAGRFGALAFQDVISVTVAVVAAIAAALLGAGYWALVVQAALQPAVVLVLAVAGSGWRPGRPGGFRDARRLLTFGGNNLLLQVANLASRTADVVALGHWQGATALGLYSRASQLVSIIFQQLVSPLTRVVLPRLSSAAADDSEFERLMITLQRAVGFVLVGALSLAASVAPSLLTLLLGGRWAATAEIFRVLSLGAAFAALGYVYYWGYLAKARTGYLLAFETPGRLVMVVGAVLCAPGGAVAVSWAICAGQFVTLVQSVASARRIQVSGRRLLLAALTPCILFATATAVSMAAQAGRPSTWSTLLIGFLAWAGVCVLGGLIRPLRGQVMQVLALLVRR